MFTIDDISLFFFLHRLIYVTCLKGNVPLAHTHVLSRECHWSMDALCVVQCCAKRL